MSSFFIRRPIFAIVISIIIVILGGLSLLSLPIAQYPQISPPTVNLSTTYTGANATIVNQTVAQVIEDQLKGVDDMSYMSSTSSNDGSYSLSVVFSLDSDGNTDAINVQNDANLAKNSLPSDVQTQGLTVRRASGDMVLMANIYSPNGTYNQAFLKNYADIYLLDKIQRIDGVGSVNTFGSSYAMRVWLNLEKLAERGLTVSDVRITRISSTHPSTKSKIPLSNRCSWSSSSSSSSCRNGGRRSSRSCPCRFLSSGPLRPLRSSISPSTP